MRLFHVCSAETGPRCSSVTQKPYGLFMVFIWFVSHRTRTSLLGFQPAGRECQTASLPTIIPLVKIHTSKGRAGKPSASLCKEQLCCREALVHTYGAGAASSQVSTTAKASEMWPHGKGSTSRAASTLPTALALPWSAAVQAMMQHSM